VPLQRIAFTVRIKPGTQEENRRRHRRISRAGCHNYSSYLRGTDLFAYLEVEDFSRYLEVMAESAASERWEAQMRDILIRETEVATGFPSALEEVLHLN
jgi:L-rhamnose mutarotase